MQNRKFTATCFDIYLFKKNLNILLTFLSTRGLERLSETWLLPSTQSYRGLPLNPYGYQTRFIPPTTFKNYLRPPASIMVLLSLRILGHLWLRTDLKFILIGFQSPPRFKGTIVFRLQKIFRCNT